MTNKADSVANGNSVSAIKKWDTYFKEFNKQRDKFCLSVFIRYLFSTCFLDIITTLLTDENLKHEGNITTFFVDNKQEFII